MIYFDKVSKIYSPTSIALEDVSFSIAPNEFISLVGQSGAGKSTLLKLLLAEERPSSGKVFFESHDVHNLTRKDLPGVRRRMGVVFQDYRLLPHKTAYENVAFALEAAGAAEEDIERDVPQVLELVGLMDKAWHFPHELSGGEKQRVAIARAIVTKPDVVIADEPTGNLDPVNTHDIISLLEKINGLNTTIILATHDKDIINSLRRRVVTLDRGKVVRDEERGKYVL
ncbi:cell division ATP-binding protein FtsE [Candidatus Giovannonibacteria bacterium RIFCSPHIGHO2_02_43_13]|uniref:Cell division ATP-binding protein FtsE n=1 Tax=Candidatus Giovannonibacteria bacterium RIFCSPHIGHO2_02_43_13 TaxID=1798330 RepID=A0A1F5WPX6_9BACT|nr:MAG: Cell division ATP-binding protein FtsE [Parcubacteria group bacterium GW2011_GWA2_44_13]OGF74701.1 MAG: cell division ATP-binding protein FtsE [Candidatus Giovannonibacteria bacterium RIFCSPHIGHO2_12_FULL_44_42]OGF77654.1 MAG: cell division ATP-binding protein FtsE [Candidatus Giovannonibacteria bacterium RIFCSPHIGHO2_02_43_13]OGF89348.1 MAG: cell division ATP-binding protein FtsE [Candidatus Giovannonibacteria bacterium RIFCSPLOWO2_02_FULL_43_54]OGF96994.1 MAG: cell division ATP-bindin